MYPRQKNWTYNRLVKPHEAPKVVEIVNPEIVSIEADNSGKLIRPDGSNEKISFKKPAKTLEGKGKKKPKKKLILKKRAQRVAVIMRNQKNPEKDQHKDYWRLLIMKKKKNISIIIFQNQKVKERLRSK